LIDDVTQEIHFPEWNLGKLFNQRPPPMMTALLERATNALGDIAHFARTPSLTDTEDSAPSSEDAPLSPPPPPPATLSHSPKTQRPLPRIPSVKRTESPEPASPLASSPTLAPSTHVRTNSQSSGMMLSQLSVLSNLLRYLTWHEFRSLVLTSRTVRAALDVEERLDVILARFVPGYGYGARPPHQIPVSLEDLETFSECPPRSVYLGADLA
jgi:hypothetical protein